MHPISLVSLICVITGLALLIVGSRQSDPVRGIVFLGFAIAFGAAAAGSGFWTLFGMWGR